MLRSASDSVPLGGPSPAPRRHRAPVRASPSCPARRSALFFLRRLVDGEHPHFFRTSCEETIRSRGPSGIRLLLAFRQNHVDAVVGQDEAACAGFRRDFGRNRPHAGRQDGGHEPRAVGFHQLLLADRFAGDERCAGDRADDLLDGLGPVLLANEAAAANWIRSRSATACFRRRRSGQGRCRPWRPVRPSSVFAVPARGGSLLSEPLAR